MAALLKYFMGVAVILPVVIFLSAATMRELFGSFPAVAPAPTTETPRWNRERLKAGAVIQYVGRGSLSPIYPAVPGKELLEKPVSAASANRIKVRQAPQLHKLPLQLFPESEQNNNFPQQSLSFTETRPLFPRTRLISAHGIY